ncbi:UNVERIFIED_CONTAM: uroporphyrinogen-III synthase [Halobacillus marinus]|uniref:uroporphyrinogen-III synthase n=1 Tax=Halobacillus sp. BAB-2008 TaxID=1246484 RepID=UPI0002A4D130|nr:uroporphyrinogen-III synthase [Halobacillus sp. BAB-2008]ELK46122.1 uroporphyrinogen-III synthase [Halobacillus sp. BAB-2008]
MSGLTNKHIGVAADRRSEAITSLIENLGGRASVYPIQGKQVLHEERCVRNVKDYLDEPFDLVVLTTGIGARTLNNAASERKLSRAFVKKLNTETLAVRGSKTMDWLKENEIKPALVAADGTMKDLVERIQKEAASGGRLFLQAYDQDDAVWKESLEQLGFSVYLSKPYTFEKPSLSIIDNLKNAIFAGELDAVVFTSKTQVKNLFEKDADRSRLTASFEKDVTAVAVGKVTAEELAGQGISTVIQPARPKMGAMVVTLDRYYKAKASEIKK